MPQRTLSELLLNRAKKRKYYRVRPQWYLTYYAELKQMKADRMHSKFHLEKLSKRAVRKIQSLFDQAVQLFLKRVRR